jgi:hypothetical protein
MVFDTIRLEATVASAQQGVFTMQLSNAAITQSDPERCRLRRLTTSVVAAVAIAAMAGVALSSTIAASSDESPRRCSLETLKGRYLFANSGILLPPGFGVTQPTPAADAGFHIFNGDGTGTDTVTFSIGGHIILEDSEAPITYTVNPDCSGSYTVNVPNGPSFALFIAPDGDQLARIPTAPAGNYGSSIDRRISRR